MQNPIWQEDCKIPRFPRLEEDVKTDVLIIGGGMCGVLTAYFLKWAGVNYCLVEADRIGSGVSGRTTAKISALQGTIYQELTKKSGRESAQLYYQACIHALERYRCMSKTIDCDFNLLPAYTYTQKDRKKIEDEIRAIRCIGGTGEFVEQLSMPFGPVEAVKMPHQAQFHPIKFMAEIAKDLNIYENTRIQSVSHHTAKSAHGSLTAKKIIFATHFPFVDRTGGYPVKLYQERSYVLGFRNAMEVGGIYLDEACNGLSLRNEGDILLVGGNAHRTGKMTTGWEPLREFKKKYCPGASEVYRWATQDCMTLDGLPYIGRYSWRTPNWLVATGFGKWGMTASMIAALLLRDMVLERKNEFEALFSPQRNMMHKQLFVNGVEAILNFVAPTPKRCPHLGCSLKWNAAEHTWDCPCHGSRFSETGRVLDNPANGNLRHST